LSIRAISLAGGIEIIISRLQPRKTPKESIRAVVIKKQEKDTKLPMAGALNPEEKASFLRGDCSINSSEIANKEEIEQRFELKFSVGEAGMKKLRKAQALASNKNHKGQELEALFDEMLELYLEKHSPERKAERREKRVAKKKDVESTKDVRNESLNLKPIDRHTRCKSPAVRDEVFKRDKGRCRFVAPDGTRCNSDWQLEVDHIQPISIGGSSDIDNLRIFCKVHNLHAAEKVLGKEFMGQFYAK